MSSTPYTTVPSPSRTAQIHQSITSTLRPWRELLSLSALSLPISFSDVTYRLRLNLYHFRINYTIIQLLILFLSLLYHPISIIIFLLTFIAWLYFFFFRDEPLVVFNRTIDDRIVLGFLTVFTIVALVFTSVWLNVVVSLVIGTFIVCFHAVIMAPDEIGDQESPYGALLSVVDSPRGSYGRV